MKMDIVFLKFDSFVFWFSYAKATETEGFYFLEFEFWILGIVFCIFSKP